MKEWNNRLCADYVLDYDILGNNQRRHLMEHLNEKFPFDLYEKHRQMRQSAIANEKRYREELSGAKKSFPDLLFPDKNNREGSTKYAVVLTAGGDGERLRQSLEKRGYGSEALKSFTKATFPLPDFYRDFGTLHVNLALISYLEKEYGVEIPVIVTTGPQGSATGEIIPGILKKNRWFGLRRILVIRQQERLHLTCDEKVAWFLSDDMPVPVTHPDETGGPLMSLKYRNHHGVVPLEWLNELGVERLLVLQATAIYNPDMISTLANAEETYDCIGVGILRRSFPEDDPYGTYAAIENKGRRRVVIIEKNVRDRETEKLISPDGRYYLPYNTGFYTFKRSLLLNMSLPDYASPPKQLLPHIEPSPKIGYAATDLIGLAEKPAVLVVPEEWYRVLKNADNLPELSAIAGKYGLDKICERAYAF